MILSVRTDADLEHGAAARIVRRAARFQPERERESAYTLIAADIGQIQVSRAGVYSGLRVHRIHLSRALFVVALRGSLNKTSAHTHKCVGSLCATASVASSPSFSERSASVCDLLRRSSRVILCRRRCRGDQARSPAFSRWWTDDPPLCSLRSPEPGRNLANADRASLTSSRVCGVGASTLEIIISDKHTFSAREGCRERRPRALLALFVRSIVMMASA